MKTPTDHVKAKPGPAFPNEIQDRVLDFLHGSKPDLQACAFVCRAWVPRSRYHLFFKTVLSENNADNFEEVFENPNCTIRSCVHLEVWGGTTKSAATRMTETLVRYISKLTPSSLLLKGWPILDLRTLATVVQCSPNTIEHLYLGVLRFENIHDLDDLLVNFPNIRELHMDDCVLYRNASYARDFVSFTPRLRSLKLSRCKVAPFLSYFLRGGIAPADLLSIKGITYGDVSVVGEYFSIFGDVLHELHVTFKHSADHDILSLVTFCKHANLQCLTALQSMSIVVGFFYWSLPSNFITTLASILDQLPCSNLKKLSVGIPMVDSSSHIGEWHRIGEVVQNKFSQLEELVFMLEEHAMGQPYENVKKWIRRDLRTLDQRGILSVR